MESYYQTSLVCLIFQDVSITMMKNTEEAFRWIVGILEKHQISFQISGGFAARMYGVSRELADIDIDVLEKDLSILYSHVKDFAIYGPTRYQDEHWDIFFDDSSI